MSLGLREPGERAEERRVTLVGAQPFWPTVWVLLRSARRRYVGRSARTQELLRNRAGKSGGSASSFGGLQTAFSVFFMLIIHGIAAMTLVFCVKAGMRTAMERDAGAKPLRVVRLGAAARAPAGPELQGSGPPSVENSVQPRVQKPTQAPREDVPLVAPDGFQVSRGFYDYLDQTERQRVLLGYPREYYAHLQIFTTESARLLAEMPAPRRVSQQQIQDAMSRAYLAHGMADFHAIPGWRQFPLRAFARPEFHGVPSMFGSLVLLWWALMLTFQGEGVEADLTRRRNPMWEWLFAHPVPVGAVFLAEMIAPVAANPIYWVAPVFPAVVYGAFYGPLQGLVAGLVVGVPLALATGCLGKAIEIGVTLRVAPRQRGAVIGLMAWMGYASMMAVLFGMVIAPKLPLLLGRALLPLAGLPWPWLRLFLGVTPRGGLHFVLGMATCVVAAGLLLGAAVGFSIWGTQKGLAGGFATAVVKRGKTTRFGKEPLYRKEMLWFVRDRSALVQAILVPLTVSATQVFNLRGVLRHAQGQWNYLSGAAVIFGTYFLWILGPKSLASEGSALWIALTWPRGLEALLKAKARLWAMLSTGLVALVLVYAGLLFPAAWWRILLVGVAWVLFARSMAAKAVTLVTTTSESGEVQKLRGGTRLGAQMGMLTFAIGIVTQQWNVAAVGIVYSSITSAAMWQNFRARLPYLYDPWSEVLPEPPTLVHAMVAISVMVEVAAVLSGLFVGFWGHAYAAAARAAAYGVSAVVVCVGVKRFLDNRGVPVGDLLVWRETFPAPVTGGGFGAAPVTSLNLSGPPVAVAPVRPTVRERLGSSGRQAAMRVAAKVGIGLGVGVGLGLALGWVGVGWMAALHHVPALKPLLAPSDALRRSEHGWRVAYLVMAVGFAPPAEEFLFRGLVYRALDREWGGWRALVGSAAFFAVYHPVMAWPLVFALAAVNGWLFKRTRNLLAPVVLHMVYNAVVLSR